MKQSTSVALVVFMTAGIFTLKGCDQPDCKAHPNDPKCRSSGSHGGGFSGGGGGGGSGEDAAHGVSTGGFGDSAGGHGGGGGGE